MTPEPTRSEPVRMGVNGPSGAARVGDELRARREALGWDLGEIATALRIRLPYLEALERGDTKAVPGNAYALGFLRNYANILGLDPDPICKRFRDESRDVNRKTELAFPAPVPERGVPAGAAVLVGLLVMGAVYAGWYHFSSHTTIPAQSVPPLPAPMSADGSTPPATAQQPSPAVASVLPDGQAARPPSVLPAPPATPQPATQPASPSTSVDASTANTATPGGASPNSGQTAAAPSTPAPSAPVQTAPGRPATAAADVPPTPAAATPAATTAAPGEVALVATAQTWVQVRRDGHVLYDHTMNDGDRWVLPPGAGQAVMTVGNAGGLTVSNGGVAGQPLGRDGAVLRNVKLGAETAPEAAAGSPSMQSGASSSAPAPLSGAASTDASSAGLESDFSGGGNALAAQPKARPRRSKPAPAPAHEPSADELNGRQLQKVRPAPPP